VPMIVALPPLFWVVDGLSRVTLLTLGRDQGIFQYIAWAVSTGSLDYGDVRDVNGPLIHSIHLLFLALGGGDEHRFRELDVGVSLLAFACVGACLPGLGRLARSPAPCPRAPFVRERLAWSFATAVILSGQYLLYLYWDLAQRESFCDWFVLIGLGLQLVAHVPTSRAKRDRAMRTTLFVLAGFASVLPWFGKPTFALFTIMQIVTLAIDGDTEVTLRRRMGAFAVGGVVAALTQLAYLARYADVRAFLRITFVDVPVMYRFIWPKSPAEIFAQAGSTPIAALALVTTLVFVALIVDGQIPKRALGVALLPIVGLANVLVQKKGFPYHFHPVTAGYYLQWVALTAWLSERLALAPRRRTFLRLGPLLAAAGLSLRLTTELAGSPHIQNIWILAKGETAELRAGHDFLVYFRDHDFFPWEMRQTADYLRARTRPEDRVQLYGMDPYVLFLAKRKSATPFIYAYDLNADAALNGGFSLFPNDSESSHIRDLRDAHEADMLARLMREPPAAFVFIDKAPLISSDDARADFTEHCPKTAAWLATRYQHKADFGEFHVLLRTDLATASVDAIGH
jgi:hypothetical protein